MSGPGRGGRALVERPRATPSPACARWRGPRMRRWTSIVVDNGSGDGSADAVALEHPGAELVRNGANLGFAGGMNVGIRAALARGAEAVLTLNNDMEVEPRASSSRWWRARRRPAAAAACAQILFAGDPPRIWYAGAR